MIKVNTTSTATTGGQRSAFDNRRLYVTEIIDNGITWAVMLSIGAGAAVRRSKALRAKWAAKLGNAPELRCERYSPAKHDFLLGLDHLRVGKMAGERQRDRAIFREKLYDKGMQRVMAAL